MKTWIVRVVATPAWLGNPNDPLIWHFTVGAETGAEAETKVRCSQDMPHGAAITAVAHI